MSEIRLVTCGFVHGTCPELCLGLRDAVCVLIMAFCEITRYVPYCKLVARLVAKKVYACARRNSIARSHISFRIEIEKKAKSPISCI